MILIVVKQYVYSNRCRGLQLRTNELKNIIYELINIEKFYAKKDVKMNKFNAKWNTSQSTIEEYNIESIDLV